MFWFAKNVSKLNKEFIFVVPVREYFHCVPEAIIFRKPFIKNKKLGIEDDLKKDMHIFFRKYSKEIRMKMQKRKLCCPWMFSTMGVLKYLFTIATP